MFAAYWFDHPLLFAALVAAFAFVPMTFKLHAVWRKLRDDLDQTRRERDAAMERLDAAHFLANATKGYCLGGSGAALRCVCTIALICDPEEVREDAGRIPEAVQSYVREVAVSAVESARRCSSSSSSKPSFGALRGES